MTTEEKQEFLRVQILDKGYDGEAFAEFLEEKKGTSEPSEWSIPELKSAVTEFIKTRAVKAKEEDYVSPEYPEPKVAVKGGASQLLKIIPKKPVFFIDDLIEGQIELNSSSQIQLNDINIVLNADEYWKDDINNTLDQRNDLVVKINLEIKKQLNMDSNLITLNAGKYSFKFKLQIPKKIEPSFEFPCIEGKGYLRYPLFANIISPSVKGSTSTYLILKKRYQMETKKQLVFNIETTPHKLGLFDGGRTKMEIKSVNGSSLFKYGRDINFNVCIDNTNGKLNSTECKAVLLRTVVFKTKLSQTKKTVTDKLLSKRIKAETNPGERKDFIMTLNLGKCENKNFDIPKSGMPYTDIGDISFFLPSIKSNLIDCSYSIKFTLYFNSFVKFNERPRIIIDVSFCHQSLEEYNKEMEAKAPKNNMIPQNNMMPPNMPNYMPPNMPPQMQPNNMIPTNNLTLQKYMSSPLPNQQAHQMDNNINPNNNQDMDLPSMEEVEDNKSDNGNYNNNYNNFNNNFQDYYQKMNNNNQNNQPPVPQNMDYPEYPEYPEYPSEENVNNNNG